MFATEANPQSEMPSEEEIEVRFRAVMENLGIKSDQGEMANMNLEAKWKLIRQHNQAERVANRKVINERRNIGYSWRCFITG